MNIRSITTVGAALVMSTVAVIAQDWTMQSSQAQAKASDDWTQNLYAKVDAGVMFQQDATLDEIFSTSASATATFKPGIRGDIALGYNINKSWTAEFETGLLWDSLDTVGGTSLSSLNQSFDTYTVPFLANIVYKVPINSSWFPYLGIGVGGAASIASFDATYFNPITQTSTSTSVGDYNFVFAYQAEAGLEYKLAKTLSVDVAYKFLGTSNPSWNFSELSGHVKEEGFYTHSIVVGLTWNF